MALTHVLCCSCVVHHLYHVTTLTSWTFSKLSCCSHNFCNSSVQMKLLLFIQDLFLKSLVFYMLSINGKIPSVSGLASHWVSNRAGTIRSAAVLIRIRYGPCQFDTYSIRYTCTLIKVSKSRIVDFNNKVNVLVWSITVNPTKCSAKAKWSLV